MGRPEGSYRVSDETLLTALTEAKGSVRDAAKLAGMTPAGIHYRLRREPMLRYKLEQIRGAVPDAPAETEPDEDTGF